MQFEKYRQHIKFNMVFLIREITTVMQFLFMKEGVIMSDIVW